MASATAGGSGFPGCLHVLFEEQVRLTPGRVALVDGDRRFTYLELDAQANRLADQLLAEGVGTEDLVGICLERSAEVVVSILAILKAGAAYVPLDPVHPAERLLLQGRDCGARLVLTADHLRPKLEGLEAKLLKVALGSSATQDPAPTPRVAVTPVNLCYVIYTSGSTGRPKGVLVTHHNVARLFATTDLWFRFGPEDVFSLFHTYAFDFSVWEIWGALLFGGRVVVVPQAASRSTPDFYSLVARERVTVLSQTPSAFRQFLRVEDTAAQRLPLALRFVVFGGEALELQSLRPWFERHGDERPCLVNMYGITETTVHTTFRIIRKSDVERRLGSVIGVPLPDSQVHLLDENLKPVPAGEVGEVFVGGPGVARGYLNRPELTDQRFLPDPFSSRPGTRLYRSGDLARQTPGGEMEYCGRSDFQVKIRGFRIELAEIESALNGHPLVRESVVLARDAPGGERCLVAYVVAGIGSDLTVAELRAHLKKSLPDYMIPSAHVLMTSLPLTENGKVDRAALPVPELSARASAAYVAPSDSLEAALAGLWQELLGLDRVGIHDDFFEVGGQSLQATELAIRTGRLLKVEVPVLAVYETPTVARMADRFRHAGGFSRGGVIPMVVEGKGPNLFFLNGAPHTLAQLLSPEFRTFAVYSPVEQEAYVLGRKGRFTLPTEELAARFVNLITQFQPTGPYHLAGFSYGGCLAYEVARQFAQTCKEVRFLCLLEAVNCGGLRRRLRPWMWAFDTLISYATRPGAAPAAVRLLRGTLKRAVRSGANLRRLLGLPPGDLQARFEELWCWNERRQRFTSDRDVPYEAKVHLFGLAEARYRARSYSGDVLLFQSNDYFVGSHKLDSTHGWGAVVKGHLTISKVPGGHLDMLDRPAVVEVANRIRQACANLQPLRASRSPVPNDRRPVAVPRGPQVASGGQHQEGRAAVFPTSPTPDYTLPNSLNDSIPGEG